MIDGFVFCIRTSKILNICRYMTATVLYKKNKNAAIFLVLFLTMDFCCCLCFLNFCFVVVYVFFIFVVVFGGGLNVTDLLLVVSPSCCDQAEEG